ncbi:hypothetical protein IW261DRAFT_1473756 [Armillaria novae-zelandiae]|uniref:Uncharacterized protein n=1 Tax=Armillaria novae-zelandiae TaxID=153914 RepID=A0AA39UFT9_9AGAR|nr:hypothetical protein IW261DRAFT_1473756 [Armillaria novae-zelandiae]
MLLPPVSSPDTLPRYHISASTNWFTPSSYMTNIRKGASESGEFVGEFDPQLFVFVSGSIATRYFR